MKICLLALLSENTPEASIFGVCKIVLPLSASVLAGTVLQKRKLVLSLLQECNLLRSCGRSVLHKTAKVEFHPLSVVGAKS
ncbi:hypothetical protein L1987_15707 [Smallanthus sonchifolius]|uniref:Uncharacterized protein n=1 Tax=Smallanthus sonchifolius TaxID=185202 RepID=A0ACB9J6P2_9ASTR|nr:hypothetical protein L1987_15707 [Smallanthus sonchifolius]